MPFLQTRSGYLEGDTELLIEMRIGESSTLVLTSSLPAVAFTDGRQKLVVFDKTSWTKIDVFNCGQKLMFLLKRSKTIFSYGKHLRIPKNERLVVYDRAE